VERPSGRSTQFPAVHPAACALVLLHVSVRTVQKHLAHVYEKLGVRTRTAAAMLVFGRRGSQLDG
jgi:hypothetical protein